jgi:hypothetical protein
MKWLMMSASACLLALVSTGSVKADYHHHGHGHRDFHSGHFDYHRGHFDYRPAHFDYHRGSHHLNYGIYGSHSDHSYRSSRTYPGSYYAPGNFGGRPCGN